MKFRSSAKGELPHTQGTLQARINHPADLCIKLQEGVSLELGALVEPLSVAIHASRRARLKEEPGLRGKVFIFGAGTVGLLVAAVCKLEGVKRVVIVDVNSGRVNFAIENGFAHEGFVVPLRRGETTEENLDIAKTTASEIGRLKSADGKELGEVDAVFECTGVSSCLQAAIYVRYINESPFSIRASLTNF
jgi:L-iditol 2-dehydrogenase